MMRARNLLALLSAALLPCGCGVASRLPEGATYLPADTAFVLSLDLPALTSTALYQELSRSGGAVALNRLNVYKFAEATGLDPSKDVRWLTFVGRGGAETGPPLDQLSAVVTGSFDGSKIHGVLKDSGLPSEPHEGLDIFPIVIVDGRCRFCIGILDVSTAAFGDGETLRSMAEVRRSPGEALAADAGARRLLSRVNRGASAWGLVRGRRLAGPISSALARLEGQGGAASALAGVSDLAFFVSTGETIAVAVDALAASSEDALLIADVLEGAGAMGRLALKQVKPEASSLLSSFRVEVDGPLVRAAAAVSSDRLIELAREAARAFTEGMSAAGLPSGERTEGSP